MASTPTDSQRFFGTKLDVPPVPAWAVQRPRLLDLLDAGAAAPLTLVSGPAGSGKTALLAAWIEARRAPGSLAWVSLGPRDGQRRRFWATVVAALAGAAAPLRSLSIPPATRIDSFLPALVDLLAGLKRPLTLVLDDFHEVGSGAVVADLDAIIEHPPERLRLILSTRADPALRLERLRVAGALSEIRAQDLAFTLAETGELGAALQLGLGAEDIETLWRRTEGWAAALRLAAHSLRGRADPHAFVEGFAGDDAALSDYLLVEVIARQPPETLDFLKRTAIVDRLNGGLADALTAGTCGSRTLAELAHGDGLVDQLDASGAWYRYHGLFAEVLRMELARTAADEVPDLHRRAARWHADNGQPLEAIRHAVSAQDWDLVARVTGEHWLTMLLRGEGPLLLEALGPTPEDVVRTHAELALAVAGLKLDAADDRGADELLGVARDGLADLPEPRRRRALVAATSTELYLARIRGNVEETLATARAVLQEDWELGVADDVRALTLTNLGIAEFWADRLDEARRHLQQAVGIARARGNAYLLFLSQGYAAAAELQGGRLGGAWRRASEAVELAASGGWTAAPQAAIAYITLAGTAVFRNELETAEDMVERARAAIDRSGERLVRLGLAQLDARLLAARGDPLTALDVLRGAIGAAPSPLPRFLGVWAHTLEADLLLAIGEPAEACKVVHELDEGDRAREAALGRGRLELAHGRPDGAIRAVADFFADSREVVQPNARVEAWVLDAIARDGIHDEDGALGAIERAMDLAEPRGFHSPFVRHGGPVRSLVRRRIRAGTSHRAFAGELLVSLGDLPGHDSRTNGMLLDPLSDRELAVLRFLPTMMSNAEIAGEMFVSVNTVKTHLKHVYRKLEVTDRRDAVRRGRELHLLSPGLGER